MQRRSFIASAAAATIAATTFPVSAQPLPRPAIELGDDVFLGSAWRDLGSKTVGIIANQSGVTSRLESIVDAIRHQGKVHVKAIFAPEHGLRGDRPAGAAVGSYVDPASGLPVYSLYGATRHPSAAMLAGIDVLLFDIQDVGSRAYTYISTMAYAMQAAKTYGKEFWVLDRPNPVGGTTTSGGPENVMIGSMDGKDYQYILPATHWVAHMASGLFWVHRNSVPAATIQGLQRRGGKANIYLFGGPQQISSGVAKQLSQYGTIVRVTNDDPVAFNAPPTDSPEATAIAFAKMYDPMGMFGWKITGPGHGFTLVNVNDWQAAVASAPVNVAAMALAICPWSAEAASTSL